MIYKVSRTVDEHELDSYGSDNIYRNIIHKLVNDMSIADLGTIFRMSQEKSSEFTFDEDRAHIFQAIYNTNIPKIQVSQNGKYPPINSLDLMGELVLFSISNSNDETATEYLDTGMYSLDTICNTICNVANVDKEFFTARTRLREHVVLRQTFYYLAHRFSYYKLREIGEYLGYDHATVIHGINQIINLLNSPGEYKLKGDMLIILKKLRMAETI